MSEFLFGLLCVSTCLFVVGILRIVKYAEFAQKVVAANVRSRYKAIGGMTATAGILTGVCLVFTSIISFSLWIILFLTQMGSNLINQPPPF